MQRIVLSLGGSIIVPDDIQADFLKEFKKLLVDRFDTMQFVVFCGGGKTARRYQDGLTGTLENATSDQLDWVGIYSSHLNARFMQQVFGDDAEDVMIIDPTEEYPNAKPVLIGGGWKPGWSTDYDAVQFAVKNGIDRVVNLSNITHAYDKDPNQFDDAQPITEIAWPEFRKIVGDEWKPGLNMPFDPIASKLAEESGIEVVIADGTNLANLSAIIDGEAFEGTRIHS